MEDKIYQGLTIDGGGILGIGAAKALMMFEEESGKPIQEQFDFIAGTSTGGIIAVLLGIGFSAKDIYNLYIEKGNDIFYRPGLLWALNPFNPRYSTEKFEKILDEYCGKRTMKDVKLPVFVTTTNIIENQTHVFYQGDDELLKDVILKTTAAPTYFPPRGEFVDGGIWANDPAMVGTLGFKRVTKCDFDQIKVLSLGTTGDYTTKPFNLKMMTIAHWIKPLINFLLLGNEASTEFFMKQLGLNDYERIDPNMDKQWEMDEVKSSFKFSDKWESVYNSNRERFQKFFR